MGRSMRRNWRGGAGRLGALVLVAALLPALPAGAQVGLRPAEERPELEEFAPEEPSAPLALPPIPPPAEPGERLSSGLGVFVRAFQVEGSTVFSDEELARVTSAYVGRSITSEELLAARDAITAHYVERGYITSGAVIPDQSPEDGVVRIEVVEGVLAEVSVEGTEWFRPGCFRRRLARAGRAEQALSYLVDYERAFILRNGFHANGDQIGAGLSRFRYRPFTLEGNFLAMQAVHEMLLQSWGGRVRVFPAVPKTWAEAYKKKVLGLTAKKKTK